MPTVQPSYDLAEALALLGDKSEQVNADLAGAAAAADELLKELVMIPVLLKRPLLGIVIDDATDKGVPVRLKAPAQETTIYIQHSDASGTIEIVDYGKGGRPTRTKVDGLRYNPIERRLEGEAEDSFYLPAPGSPRRRRRTATAIVVEHAIRALDAKTAAT